MSPVLVRKPSSRNARTIAASFCVIIENISSNKPSPKPRRQLLGETEIQDHEARARGLHEHVARMRIGVEEAVGHDHLVPQRR